MSWRAGLRTPEGSARHGPSAPPRTRLGSFSAPSSRVPDLGRRDDGSFGVEAVPTYGTGRLTGAKEAVVAVIRGARAATGPVWGAQGSHSVPAEKSNISLGKKER